MFEWGRYAGGSSSHRFGNEVALLSTHLFRGFLGRISARMRRRLRTAFPWLLPIRHWGFAVRCPCCGGRFRGFLPFTGIAEVIPGVECPACGAHHRHRLLALYFAHHPELLRSNERLRLLHVAPELPIIDLLRRCAPALAYVSTGFDGRNADLRASLTELPFRSNSLDCVLAIHVLEHIEDDAAAMQEILRVLAPGGWAILQVPLDSLREKTDEDPAVTSPAERERRFGQRDHVRLYGRDYHDRLVAAGFAVRVDPFVRTLPRERQERFGLEADEDLYVCFKPGVSAF
jgi:hypothetical protein